jgi:hypothetical protein
MPVTRINLAKNVTIAYIAGRVFSMSVAGRSSLAFSL